MMIMTHWQQWNQTSFAVPWTDPMTEQHTKTDQSSQMTDSSTYSDWQTDGRTNWTTEHPLTSHTVRFSAENMVVVFYLTSPNNIQQWNTTYVLKPIPQKIYISNLKIYFGGYDFGQKISISIQPTTTKNPYIYIWKYIQHLTSTTTRTKKTTWSVSLPTSQITNFV